MGKVQSKWVLIQPNKSRWILGIQVPNPVGFWVRLGWVFVVVQNFEADSNVQSVKFRQP